MILPLHVFFSQPGPRVFFTTKPFLWWKQILRHHLTTFMCHTYPNPLCISKWVKLQSQWSCDEPEKSLGSVHLDDFFVCTPENMCTCDMTTHGLGSLKTPSCFMDVCILQVHGRVYSSTVGRVWVVWSTPAQISSTKSRSLSRQIPSPRCPVVSRMGLPPRSWRPISRQFTNPIWTFAPCRGQYSYTNDDSVENESEQENTWPTKLTHNSNEIPVRPTSRQSRWCPEGYPTSHTLRVPQYWRVSQETPKCLL